MRSLLEDDDRSPRFLKLPQVIERLNLSRSEIYRRCRESDNFPKPLKIGARSVVWVDAEIDAFVRNQIARRDAKVRSA